MIVFAYVMLGLVSVIILTLLFYLIIGAILFKIAFSRKSVTARILRKDTEKRLKDYKIDLCWWEKVKFEKVSIKSFDGLNLVGFYFDNKSDKTVIIVHGFGQNHLEMQPYCKMFGERNFNVLAIDLRTHGESEGNCITYGWLERLDIISWTNFLSEKNPNVRIVLFGVSMGGSAVCMASGEKDLKNVVAVVSDCAFDNASREFDHVMKTKHIKLKFIKKLLINYTKRLYNFDLKNADTIKQVKNTKVPILFIHGQKDDFVPIENLNNLFNSTPQNLREKYIVEEATHAMSYSVDGVLYEKKVFDFLKNRTPKD